MTANVSLTREQRIAYLQQLQAQKQTQNTASATVTSVQDSVFAKDIATNTCTDGVDDGKIDTFSKIGNAVEGVGKSVVNMVTSAIQPKNWLKTALAIGACCIPVVGPIVGAGLACYGVYQGGKQIINAAQLAESATTDAEAKAAWENIGGGAFTTGISIVGLKGSASALKGQLNGGSATVNAYRNGETSTTQILENAAKETGQNALKICETAVEKARKIKDGVDAVKVKGLKNSINDAKKVGKEWMQDNITDKGHTKRDAKAAQKASDDAAQAKFDAQKAELDSKYGINEDGTKLSSKAKKQYKSESKKIEKELSKAKTTAKKTYKEATKKPVDTAANERTKEYKKALGKNSEVELSDGSTLKKVSDGYEISKGNETIKYNKKGEYQSKTVRNGNLESTTNADGSKHKEYSSDTMKATRDTDKNGNTKFEIEHADGTTKKGKTSTSKSGTEYKTEIETQQTSNGTSTISTKTTNLGNGQKITIKRVNGETIYMMDGRNVTSSIEKLQCELGATKFVNESITIPGTNITLNPNQGTALISALNAIKDE